jgi:2-keto-3-deoxy-6-phosphogluconate aldolase
MRPSEMLKALEDGKRISNTEWPEDHYWEMKIGGSIKSVGDGVIASPGYKLTDLYQMQGKWIIVPKYVNFSEAMKAVEEGKNATCYFNDEVITIVSYNNKINSICKNNACSSGGGASIPIAWIVAGKWAVEEVNK